MVKTESGELEETGGRLGYIGRSALHPLFFVVWMDILSREIRAMEPREVLFVYNQVIVVGGWKAGGYTGYKTDGEA
ncbi:hypothetical protein E2C01_090015 [Portunus trituberculatus]|uniref:Uncharacterized protein n=1 Tax=Portunus trituberculatus TaxID=210409 RepID=A0A5B7JJ55_PORTR|nr:hypothetical protein [Portunus trituberculatus]